MKAFRVAGIALLLGSFFGSLAIAGEDMRQLIDEVKAYNEKARSYMETKRSEMNALEGKINDLKPQAKPQAAAPTNAKDQKPQPNAQIEPLMVQRHALQMEIVQHEVEFAQQHVTFAQRRLQIAQQQLAELQGKQGNAAPSAPVSK